MSTAIKPAVLSEERTRELINRWNGDGFLRIKNLGDKIFIDEITTARSYNIRLRSQYEERSVSEATVPYRGGPVDEHGRPPDPWDLPVRRPTDFEDRSETVPLPHTERVTMCAACAGFGSIQCTGCAGSGRVRCPRCHGKGYVERQEMRTEHTKGGGQSTGMVTVKESCNCHNGETTCSACNGNGRNTCPTCGGACKTKQFEQVTIAFRAALQTDLLDPTDVPDHLVRAAKGETVTDERAPRLGDVPAIEPEVDQKLRVLLEKSQATNETKSRLLFQQAHVEKVDIQEVRYRYAGKALRLWIYGQDQRIHAPGLPWHWQKLLGIIGGIVGVAVLVGVIIVVATLH